MPKRAKNKGQLIEHRVHVDEHTWAFIKGHAAMEGLHLYQLVGQILETWKAEKEKSMKRNGITRLHTE